MKNGRRWWLVSTLAMALPGEGIEMGKLDE
jgi:hypothetical protein